MGDTKKEDRDFSLKKFIYSLFRPSIVKKIFYGYFSLALLIVIISAFTLSSLKKLNGLNGDIINRDDFVVETTESMIDNLFARELFVRRYLIMNSPDILSLFEERGREFERMTEKIHILGEYSSSADRIASLHAEYNDLIVKLQSLPVSKEYNTKVRKKQDELISLVKDVSNDARYALMTISIAVVNNEQGVIKDRIRVGEIAAELKAFAKSLPGSVCVADRRQETGSVENVIQFPGKSG